MAVVGDLPSDEALMRAQILRFLEEYCRGLTLGDVREWFLESSTEAPFNPWTNRAPYDCSRFPAIEAFEGR